MDQPKKRGFALLTPERRKELQSMGGKAVPPGARSFSRDPAYAARCGVKGGAAVPAEKRTFRTDRELASRAGKARQKKPTP